MGKARWQENVHHELATFLHKRHAPFLQWIVESNFVYGQTRERFFYLIQIEQCVQGFFLIPQTKASKWARHRVNLALVGIERQGLTKQTLLEYDG